MAADLYIPILQGTSREGNHTQHVARYVHERLAARTDVNTRLYDPDVLPFDVLKMREWEMEPQPDVVRDFVADMARADGFVLVFPEYNHGIPGALKDLLDHLSDEWSRKPFGMVTTGGISGGIRAAEHMRPVINGLGGVSIPMAVPVPWVKKAFDENGPIEERERWDKRMTRFFDEMAWYAGALKAARPSAPK